ncbi:uncharacterized protein LOC142357344 [Convolutriloba macropyga]|uniref:uncharacterized protein LOC142357344 n=1 Tax=Convolutriloba macropyga TaxID=536237 RepID=UPI003F527894
MHAALSSDNLEEDICLEAIKFAKEQNVTLEIDHHTDRLLFYNDPVPEGVGDLTAMVGEIAVQKMIFMLDPERMDDLRPLAVERFQGRACLTIAIPGMLEVLPLGVSKGSGVRRLLDNMGVDPADVMAIGDGENDIEMLEMVGLGVAMGNAVKKARDAATEVVSSNDEDGVAEAIYKFALQRTSPDS